MTGPSTTTATSSMRILVLAPSDLQTPSPFPVILESLTGQSPPADLSYAGYTSHPPVHLQTKYYETNVNIWCDELPPPTIIQTGQPNKTDQDKGNKASLTEWQAQMTSEAAREVREAIGAIILILSHNQVQGANYTSTTTQWTKYIEAVSQLRDMIEDETTREVASLVILHDYSQKQSLDSNDHHEKERTQANKLLEALEDECLSTHGLLGWDFVNTYPLNNTTNTTDKDKHSRNEYGEKTGIDRVIEVLEGIDWSAGSNEGDDDPEPGMTMETGIGMDMSFLDDINLSSLKHHSFPRDQDNQQQHHHQDHQKSQHEKVTPNGPELEREMMELKMAMLDIEKDNVKIEHDDSDDFGALASAELPKESKDDDVWAVLDDREDESIQVDQLQGLMERVVAIREAGSEMSVADREKFAKREISRLMKEL